MHSDAGSFKILTASTCNTATVFAGLRLSKQQNGMPLDTWHAVTFLHAAAGITASS